LVNYDFDEEVQFEFTTSFSDIPPVNWKDWLRISSKDEFETKALKVSGLDNFNDILERVKKEKTESRSFSVDHESYIKDYEGPDPLILVHTSGTTDASLKGIKWFHMSKSLVQNLWAPGMQAIFQSSNLDSISSAVIFVPSRLVSDGINEYEHKKFISFYSSEFSQRIMLSVIKPKAYLLYEYKNSKNLEIISKILSLENISVISAPAATILGWANPEKFRNGLKRSLDQISKNQNPLLEKLLNMVRNEGINVASVKIQKLLSEKVLNATLIFSISSLTSSQWDIIRNFMKWDKGKEKFTNLYVGSEIGPFASSLGDMRVARENKMYVFPLTLPVIQYKGKLNLITRINYNYGKLLVSRLNGSYPLINIDTGDVVSVEENETIPTIGGEILRAGFRLKYPINISNKIKLPGESDIYAGDLFTLNDFDIFAPRYLLDCLINNCKIDTDSLLLVGFTDNEVPWELFIPTSDMIECNNNDRIRKIIGACPKEENIDKALQNDHLAIKLINEHPVDFKATRSEILKKVQKGNLPKGILKKWALYLVVPSSISEDKIL
jgi:hypothetical protein